MFSCILPFFKKANTHACATNEDKSQLILFRHTPEPKNTRNIFLPAYFLQYAHMYKPTFRFWDNEKSLNEVTILAEFL